MSCPHARAHAHARARARAHAHALPRALAHTLTLALTLTLTLTLALTLTSPALAHPLAPAHLVIVASPTTTELTLTHGRDSSPPRFTAPPFCFTTSLSATRQAESRVEHLRWHCAAVGPLVLVAEPGAPPLIVEIHRGDDTTVTVLDAAHPVLDLAPGAPELLVTLATWTGLGMDHLFGGLDHLFLVLGLVLLVGLRRHLIAALTAFTVGHSLSLALGATQTLVLPSALVESAIALTLIALALSLIARASATAAHAGSPDAPAPVPTRASLFARAPWLTGLAVGLVHGLGFAGVLTDLGLPEDHAALALFGFNLGLELAQLAAVLAFASAIYLARKTPIPLRHLPTAAGWLLGVVSSAWLIERALGL